MLLVGLLGMLFCAGVGNTGTTEKIADKMAPKDPSGDLEKVQEKTEPTQTPAEPTPTETESISEVQLLTLPKEEIKKESEEPAMPLNLLEDPQVRKLLKPSPAFVYNPRDLKDPMIVPWVRHTLLVREFLDTLRKRLNDRRLEEAKSFISQIEELLPDISDIELRKKSQEQLENLRGEYQRLLSEPGQTGPKPAQTPIKVPEPILPVWIQENFVGVVWQPRAEDRIALFGNEILKEGEKIPKFPDATVQRINPSSVVISYRGITKEIQVERQE
jgi:hypothetical protein